MTFLIQEKMKTYSKGEIILKQNRLWKYHLDAVVMNGVHGLLSSVMQKIVVCLERAERKTTVNPEFYGNKNDFPNEMHTRKTSSYIKTGKIINKPIYNIRNGKRSLNQDNLIQNI